MSQNNVKENKQLKQKVIIVDNSKEGPNSELKDENIDFKKENNKYKRNKSINTSIMILTKQCRNERDQTNN